MLVAADENSKIYIKQQLGQQPTILGHGSPIAYLSKIEIFGPLILRQPRGTSKEKSLVKLKQEREIHGSVLP